MWSLKSSISPDPLFSLLLKLFLAAKLKREFLKIKNLNQALQKKENPWRSSDFWGFLLVDFLQIEVDRLIDPSVSLPAVQLNKSVKPFRSSSFKPNSKIFSRSFDNHSSSSFLERIASLFSSMPHSSNDLQSKNRKWHLKPKNN